VVQLVHDSGAPYGLEQKGDSTTYADLVTPEGLKELNAQAHVPGPGCSCLCHAAVR
jgi:glycerophosphoryl diester phosphodiesterase